MTKKPKKPSRFDVSLRASRSPSLNMKPPRLRHSIAALGLVQIANYLIPLITVPYLTRVLGVKCYGDIAFAQFVMQHFILLTNFGFPLSAVQNIAAQRNNRMIVNEIFCATWASQWLLAIVGLSILALMMLWIPTIKNDWPIYLAGYLMVFGNVLFPVWLLQGLERLREVAIIQCSARLLLLLPLFFIIKSPNDSVWAMTLLSLNSVLSGFLSLFWIAKNQIISWSWPNLLAIKNTLYKGTAFFISNVWIGLYTAFIPVLLGILAGHEAVGLFSLADKIRQSAQSLLHPISQALFPRMSHLYAHNQQEARQLLSKSIRITVVIAGTVSLGLWLMADWLILLMGGNQFQAAAEVLRWLAPLPFLIGLSNVFGIQAMIPNQRIRAFNVILFLAGAWCLLVIMPLTIRFASKGAAMATSSAELLVTICMAIYLYQQGFFRKTASGSAPIDSKLP